ncbi:MAG: class II glutamine amidotransferase [Prevotella sp.]|nr:class II glutamine amidotransferase [Prevotella sp.]
MCVICYIPKGVETPSREIVTAMHRANSHGMGMCTPSDKYKGMSFDTLYRHLRKRSIDEPCLLHFRLATHGSIKNANCHPFYDAITDTYFMHNGILDIEPKGDMTDSETAFRDILVPEIKASGLDSDELAYAVNYIIGYSKFAFMQGDKVRLFGDFLKRYGVYYSNLRFSYYMRPYRCNDRYDFIM